MQITMRNSIGLNDQVIPVHYHPIVLLEYYQKQGLNTEALLKDGHIASKILHDDKAKLSYSQFTYLLQQGQDILQRPALGLEFGRMLPPSSNGLLLGMSLIASENIAQAIDLAMRYKKSVAPVNTLSLHHAKEYSYVQCVSAIDESEFSQIYIEICFSCLYTGLRQIMPDIAPQIAFEFSYAEPAYKEAYTKHLNANIKFNCVQNRIILKSRFLHATLPMANKRIITEAMQMMDAIHGDADHRLGFVELINRLLRDVEPGSASLEDLAENLCTSVSSLKRRFSMHHTSFQKLLDKLRMEEACQLLEQDQLSIADIAHRIGFSDAASFRKAFKRWTGETPQDYRNNVFEWIRFPENSNTESQLFAT
ncbi:MAG: AraC family transcriptional regulator ligand-binding domain-containing protein [Pseudomonadales bacterium]|nr:AraC family transcriptional regulator ligand-binding domain-containing protein [Pseudomonadales bacterium]